VWAEPVARLLYRFLPIRAKGLSTGSKYNKKSQEHKILRFFITNLTIFAIFGKFCGLGLWSEALGEKNISL
jgi:hypothetical protein